MIDFFSSLPRPVRRLLLLLLDSVAIMLAVWASFSIRLSEWWPDMLHQAISLFPVALVISLPIFFALGFYRSVLRYAGWHMFNTIVKGVSLSLLLLIAAWAMLQGAIVPRSAWFVYWFILIALSGGSRLLLRDYLRRRFAEANNRKRVIIYGAGVAGVQIATALQHDLEFMPVGFVDDSPELRGSVIFGLKVQTPKHLPQLIRREQAEVVLLAMPSASRKQRRDILDALASLPVRFMVMPSMTELASGAKRIDDLRDVDVADILSRDPIKPNPALLKTCIRGKTVLVTGAGGSIGAELCRQIIQLGPRRLVLFELSEYGLYRIERELRSALASMARPPQLELIALLGSVNQRQRIHQVMVQFAVQTVYHAAAFKHVSIVEQNPLEGIQNNIFGTLYTAQAAAAAGVETFVLISTDKAVRPSNVMGASKRFAELVLQGLDQQPHKTCFCMVRFGNVLGSSGSIVPLFQQQIRAGGPVTVTDPEVTRYFMTIPEAAQLVIQAGAMADGGEVFLLDMGEPVNIIHIARRMIELSNFTVRDEEHPNGDIDIQFTGLKPGEKLHEELFLGSDNSATAHPMILQAREQSLPWDDVQTYLDRLRQYSKQFDEDAACAVLQEAIGEYRRPEAATARLAS